MSIFVLKLRNYRMQISNYDLKMRNLKLRITETYRFFLPVYGCQIVRTVNHFNSHYDLDKPTLDNHVHNILRLFETKREN